MAKTAKATVFFCIFNIKLFNYSANTSIIWSGVIEDKVAYFINNFVGFNNSDNSFRDILSRIRAFKTT